MPRTFFISITNQCNLRCRQCYAAGWRRRAVLTEEQIDKAVKDCHDNGVDIFTLLGGEPFTRKRLVFSLLRRYPDCLFMINSNGLLITDEVADRLALHGNVVVHLSLEGRALRTDDRRGKGTYDGVLNAMDRLRQRGVPFDVTAMVTMENKEEITGQGFIEEVATHGALAIWYTCYRPVGGEYDNELVVPYAERAKLFRTIVRLRNRLPIMLFDNQFDYTMFGGCFATLGFNTHLNSYGCIEPCPAMHYSTDNLLSSGCTAPQLYSQSKLLRAVRALHDTSQVQCPITDATGELLRVLAEAGARDSTNGADLGALERYWAATGGCACRHPKEDEVAVSLDVYAPLKKTLLKHLFGDRPLTRHRLTPAPLMSFPDASALNLPNRQVSVGPSAPPE